MMDDGSLQDSQIGVPGNIRIPREDATVATAALVASQGSTTVFQQRARCTLLEIEQDEVVVRKGNRGLPGSKIYVANRIAATQSLSSKHSWVPSIYNLKMQLAKMSKSQSTFKMSLF